MNTAIHAAVRRDLARFISALTHFPAGSAARGEQLAAAWQFLDGQLEKHHHDEETIFWPALRELGVSEEIVGDLDGEHRRMAAAMKTCDAAMARLPGAPTEDNASAALAAFVSLREIIQLHFGHEERELEPQLARHHGAPQLKAAAKEVRSGLSNAQAGDFMAWLVDDASSADRAVVTSEIPAPVVFVFSRYVGRHYNRSIKTVWTS